MLILYRELWKQAKGSRGALIIAMLLLIGAQLVLLAVPYLVGKAFDVLQARGDAGSRDAALWLLAVLGATVASWLIHGPARILERNVALGVRKRIASELTGRLLGLPLAWHEGNHSVASAHRVLQSSAALAMFAESQFIYLNSAVKLVGPIGALFVIQPIVGAVAAFGLLGISLSVAGFDRLIIRLAIQTNDAERRYTSVLADSLGNAATVLALRQKRPFVRLLEQLTEKLCEPLKRMIIVNEMKWCTVDVASRLLSCGLVGLYAWLVLRSASAGGQGLKLGSVYMVWEYALQAGAVIAAIAANFQAFATQHANYLSADVIRNSAVDESSREPIEQRSWRRCALRDVVFSHTGVRSAEPTLNHIHLSLERGKRYALIGSSGSGKSTLMRVLAGLYVAEHIVVEPSEGAILRTPVDAARFLRGSTTLIPQDAELFEASLGENLAMCESLHGEPPADRYQRALELASVSDFIAADAQALQSPIAERAANWSGGQRARVALARGILAAHGSSLVLLDEPTASLDAKTEAAVYDNLFAEFADTCIVTSVHRMNLLERFDEVLVMSNGRLVAQGPAAELAATSPEYAELHAASLRQRDADERALSAA